MTQQNQSPVVTDEELIAALRGHMDQPALYNWTGPDGLFNLAADRLEDLTLPSGKVSDEQYLYGDLVAQLRKGDGLAERMAAADILEAAQLPARPVVKVTMEMIDRYADARVDEYMHSEPPAAPSRETMYRVDKEVSEARSAILSALEGEGRE